MDQSAQFSLTAIALVWLASLLSPSIVGRIARTKRQEELKRAIAIDLRELQFTMALVGFRLFRRCRAVTPERIALLREVVNSYTGPDDNPADLKATREYLSLPEAQQMAVAAQAAETPMNSPRLVKYYLPFVEAHTLELADLPVDYQWRITQVIRDLRLFNDDVVYSTSQLDRTFDTSITGENRKSLQQNIERTYSSASQRAERIVREVRDILSRYG